MKCKIRTKEINGQVEKRYTYDGDLYGTLKEVLAAMYTDQGELYEEYGVSREDAKLAGWDPYKTSNRFSAAESGYRKFLKDGGVITKIEKQETADIKDLIQDQMNDYYHPDVDEETL
ncbi:MAG: hypothetical protein SVM80_13680 [Halobacteriota archaeon]|nr:hypothetical protein [Halobacteriota archaeon]